jgi:hypothetical protein
MDVLSGLFGAAAPGAPVSAAEIALAIGLSFLLNLLIAWVYRTTHRGPLYTQDYVHTLMLLGMVVTAVILVVGQSVERAFAIFAAFSIIRFRRSLPETRDIGFIFFAMAVGMAAGARQYPLAVLTTLLVGAVVLLISRLDLFAPERTSHLLRVRVTNDIDYIAAFEPIFADCLDRATLLSVESVQAGMMTELRYAVRLAEGASPRELVSAIQARNGNNRVLLTAFGPEIGEAERD